MILADVFEYILLGRGFYVMKHREDKQKFIKGILHFVNLLMVYETMTVSKKLRKRFLVQLRQSIPEIADEELFNELGQFNDKVGLPASTTDAPPNLNKYFDKLLPKTAGGLWHELLVYAFLIRNNYGYVIPILLTQRFYSRDSHIVPPDFLLMTEDKTMYGVEVGRKKEIQSGTFSLQTNIPTASVDTENTRNSDRCPICQKWISFCPFVIDNFSDFEYNIERAEVKCMSSCNIYTKEQIAAGECKYSKYSRNRAATKAHTHHAYSNGYHYHYTCVLSAVPADKRDEIIEAEDATAVKTHFPYYSGLEALKK